MILRGPGAKDDRYDAADIEVLDVIGKRGAEILPGYRYINIANDLYEVYGGEVDWLYAMQGVFTFTNELFTGFNFFRKASDGFFGSNEDLHAFDRYLLFGGGVAPWRQGNRILISGESAQNAFQEVFVPARLEPFASDASF